MAPGGGVMGASLVTVLAACPGELKLVSLGHISMEGSGRRHVEYARLRTGDSEATAKMMVRRRRVTDVAMRYAIPTEPTTTVHVVRSASCGAASS